jgi:hypothetical protein
MNDDTGDNWGRRRAWPDFPGSTTSGGGAGMRIGGINPRSPQFQSAQQARQSLMPARPGGAP